MLGLRRRALAMLVTGMAAAAVAVGGAAPARAADTSLVTASDCYLSATWKFRYEINWTKRGSYVRIDSFKVVDAAGGHWMQSIFVSAFHQNADGDYALAKGSWKEKVTKYPRVAFVADPGADFQRGTKDHPVDVHGELRGYTNAGGVTPPCYIDVPIYAA